MKIRSAVRLALICFTLTGGTDATAGGIWRERGFADFADGTFGNAGHNLYVSKTGALQRIFRFDFNEDGWTDLAIAYHKVWGDHVGYSGCGGMGRTDSTHGVYAASHGRSARHDGDQLGRPSGTAVQEYCESSPQKLPDGARRHKDLLDCAGRRPGNLGQGPSSPGGHESRIEAGGLAWAGWSRHLVCQRPSGRRWSTLGQWNYLSPGGWAINAVATPESPKSPWSTASLPRRVAIGIAEKPACRLLPKTRDSISTMRTMNTQAFPESRRRFLSLASSSSASRSLPASPRQRSGSWRCSSPDASRSVSSASATASPACTITGGRRKWCDMLGIALGRASPAASWRCSTPGSAAMPVPPDCTGSRRTCWATGPTSWS